MANLPGLAEVARVRRVLPGAPVDPGRGYGSDLTDEQWARLAPLLPEKKTRGEPRRHHRRLVVEAILSVLDNGVTWRNLPKGFPPTSTVDDDFARWRDDGTRQRVHDALRDRARAALGKPPGPTAAIIDSRSAKTTGEGATGVATPTNA
jgi:putative transposase